MIKVQIEKGTRIIMGQSEFVISEDAEFEYKELDTEVAGLRGKAEGVFCDWQPTFLLKVNLIKAAF